MKLSDACKLIVDCPHTSAKDEGKGIALIRTPNVGKGRLILENVHRVSEKVYQERIARATPSTGDLILAREAPVGNVAIIQEGQKVCLGQRVVLLRANEEIVLPDYLVYYLLSRPVQHRLLNQTNETTVAHLNVAAIRNLEINLPDLSTQRRISSILSSLDRKIELNNKINATLEEMAQALFKSWFVDFEPFKNGNFIDTEIGKIPEGWRVGQVIDYAQKMASGGTPKSMNESFYKGNIKWFSTKELKDCFLLDSEKHISQEAYDSSSTKMFDAGTVLMAIYAAPTVGRLGILCSEGCFNQAAVGILPKKEFGTAFVYLYLLSERYNLNNLACGAAQQNLNVRIVKEYPALIPSSDVLAKFNEKVEPLFAKILALSQQTLTLTHLRDTLLPRLMSGEIEL